MKSREAYPSDVAEEEWAFAAPYLCLMREDAPRREYPLREVFNGVRYLARAGCPWRLLPRDLPPWKIVYDQAQRWFRAGVFEAMTHDLRAVLRLLAERSAEPSAIVLDARTLQSSVESGARAGWDGHKRRKGSKVHLAVDTLGHLLALHVTAANEQERAQVSELAAQVQDITGESVALAYADQGCTGEDPAVAAQAHGIKLVVKQACRAQTRLCPAAKTLGGGALLCLERPLSQARPRL